MKLQQATTEDLHHFRLKRHCNLRRWRANKITEKHIDIDIGMNMNISERTNPAMTTRRSREGEGAGAGAFRKK